MLFSRCSRRRRRRRCRRIPGRDAAGRRGRDRRAWRLRDGRRCRRHRSDRESDRRRFESCVHSALRARSPQNGAFDGAGPDRQRERRTSARITVAPLYSMLELAARDAADSRAATPYCAASGARGQVSFRANGYHGARAAFAEERELRRARRSSSATSRGKALAGEAGFRERHGQAAVAEVVRRGEHAFARRAPPGFDQARFGGEIDGRRRAADDAANRARIFGGGKFAQPRSSVMA